MVEPDRPQMKDNIIRRMRIAWLVIQGYRHTHRKCNIVEPDRPQMTDNIIRRMRIAWSVPKAKDTNSEYVIW
jgi:hypothetical protein